jgi:hypothetical protein
LLVDLPLTSATSTTPSTASDRPVRFTVAIWGRPTALAVAGGATAGPVGVLGGCVLDLRAASFTAPVTTITAVTVLSGVDVLVPPGVRVELSVSGLFGSADSLLPEQHLRLIRRWCGRAALPSWVAWRPSPGCDGTCGRSTHAASCGSQLGSGLGASEALAPPNEEVRPVRR